MRGEKRARLPLFKPSSLPSDVATPSEEEVERTWQRANSILGFLLPAVLLAAGAVAIALAKGLSTGPALASVSAVTLTLVAILLGLLRDPKPVWAHPAREQDAARRREAASVLWKRRWSHAAIVLALLSAPAVAWALAVAQVD